MFINKVIDYQKNSSVRYGAVRRNQMFESFTVIMNEFSKTRNQAQKNEEEFF